MSKGFSIEEQQLYRSSPYWINQMQEKARNSQEQQKQKIKKANIKYKVTIPSPKIVLVSRDYFCKQKLQRPPRPKLSQENNFSTSQKTTKMKNPISIVKANKSEIKNNKSLIGYEIEDILLAHR